VNKNANRRKFSAVGNLIAGFGYRRILRRFDNLARFYTAGAHLHPAVATVVEFDADGLQIRVETPAGLVVRVGYIVPELRPLAANVASHCHK
jgi:hypothetical protein